MNTHVGKRMDENQDVSDELADRASDSAKQIDTSRTGQLSSGAVALVGSGSIGYYLAENTDFFQNAFAASELPAYTALGAVTFLAIKELASICGRVEPKTILAGVANGGAVGLGLGLGGAGVAFAVLGDVILCGGLLTVGAVVGWWFTRRGKKRHRCGTKLPCDRWICPNCRRLISPSKEWTFKDRWNVLDVCDYLDTGGREWDTVKATAFLEYSSLLGAARKNTGERALWCPEEVRARANDERLVTEFSSKWGAFTASTPLTNEDQVPQQPKDVLLSWQKFLKTAAEAAQ